MGVGVITEADRPQSLSQAGPGPPRSAVAGQAAFFLTMSLRGLVLGWLTCKALHRCHVDVLWLQ